MAEHDRQRGLTQAELAEVLRRAAEIDADRNLPVAVSDLDPLIVEAAAIEAGLSSQAVRQAINEVLHPDDTPNPYADGTVLPSRHLRLSREVQGSVADVEAQVARFLHRQLFDQQRLFADGSRWAPRKGWIAGVRKEVDPGGRFVLKQVRSVEVSVTETEADGWVLVSLTLDLGAIRNIHTGWLATGAASGVAVLGATGVMVGLDPVALTALPVAGGLTAGGHYVGRWNARKEAEKIHTAVAGLLDRIEHSKRSLTRGRRPPRTRDRSGRSRSRSEGQTSDDTTSEESE